MTGLFSRLAAVPGPSVHIAPHAVFNIGSLQITNSVFYGWLSTIFICALAIWVARRVRVKPQGGIVQFFEYGVDFVNDLVENAFEDKAIGRKYVPYFVCLFFIILLNSWLGLLPFVGEGINVGGYPLLRPLTGDLNATLAIGLVTMLLVYGASIKESGGFFKYLRHFFVGNPKNPIYFVVGIIEMFTDLTRAFSLSLRLFLNVAIGEIVITVFAYLGQLLLPGNILSPIFAVPFTLLEVAVAALQAYIFTILATMYLAMAVNGAGHETDSDLTEGNVPETIGVKATGG
jgi:F-type H+-transporting ATPase subunit a